MSHFGWRGGWAGRAQGEPAEGTARQRPLDGSHFACPVPTGVPGPQLSRHLADRTCRTACRLVDVDMNKGTVLHPYVWSLGAFWPGLQVCGVFLFL